MENIETEYIFNKNNRNVSANTNDWGRLKSFKALRNLNDVFHFITFRSTITAQKARLPQRLRKHQWDSNPRSDHSMFCPPARLPVTPPRTAPVRACGWCVEVKSIWAPPLGFHPSCSGPIAHTGGTPMTFTYPQTRLCRVLPFIHKAMVDSVSKQTLTTLLRPHLGWCQLEKGRQRRCQVCQGLPRSKPVKTVFCL